MDSTVEPASIGCLLKARRQQAGLSLKEIAERTCIRRTYLEALEADRFDLLPGEVYVQGFTRLYAEVVGLEVAPLLAQIRRQKATVLTAEDAFVGNGRRGMPAALRWGLLALLVAFVAGGLLLKLWYAGTAVEKVPAPTVQVAPLPTDQEPEGSGAASAIENGDAAPLVPPPATALQ